jgi:hypothetical protein
MWVPGPLIPMALGELLRGSSAARQVGQVLLRLQYQERRQCPEDLPALSDVEFRCYSQNGEDGVYCTSSPCSEPPITESWRSTPSALLQDPSVPCCLGLDQWPRGLRQSPLLPVVVREEFKSH